MSLTKTLPRARKRLAASAALVAVSSAAVVAAASPASAAGTWSGGASNPKITVYNRDVQGGAIYAPTSATGTITSVQWSYTASINKTTSSANITGTTFAWLCAGTLGDQCIDVGASRSGTTTAFAGFPANTTFQMWIGFYNNAYPYGPTYSPIVGGNVTSYSSVTVSYN